MRRAVLNTVIAGSLGAELLLGGCSDSGPSPNEQWAQLAIAADGFAGQSGMSLQYNTGNGAEMEIQFGTLTLGSCGIHAVVAIAELDSQRAINDIHDYKVTVGTVTQDRPKGADLVIAAGVTVDFQNAADYQARFPAVQCTSE